MLAPCRILAAIAVLALLVAPARAADPFYESLLREGQLSYERGDLEAALIELELACFGLLDEPNSLATGLVYFGVVQGKSGRPEDFEKTFRRVLELEDRFGAYSSTQVAPEIREDFENFARVIAPRGYLTSTPAFAHLAVEPEVPDDPKKRGNRKSKKNSRGKNNKNPEPMISETDVDPIVGESITISDVEAIDTRPVEDLSLSPEDTDSLVEATIPEFQTAGFETEVEDSGVQELIPEEPAFDEQAFSDASSLLASARTRSDLNQAMDIARELAHNFPEHRDAQHLVARIAYMGSGWKDVAAYYERGGESPDAELIFYSAVSYFELGRLEEARASLELALPNLTRTDYVNRYINKILEGQN